MIHDDNFQLIANSLFFDMVQAPLQDQRAVMGGDDKGEKRESHSSIVLIIDRMFSPFAVDRQP